SVVDVNQSTTPEVLPLCTPGGTKEWIPCCSIDLKPYVGMQLFSIEDGLKFYKIYAEACGFNVRKATTTKSKKGDVALNISYATKLVLKRNKGDKFLIIEG
ncbi:Protein FAR1-RELATED SEQUENCE 7, partial [Bienertia sinuspersici]